MSPAGHTLLLLAGVQVASVLSPGPNTMLVIQSAARDRKLGYVAAAGCWPASVMWVTLGLAGLGSVLAAAPWLAATLRVVCGAYLVVLGLKALFRSFKPRLPVTEGAAGSWRQTFAAGFVTNATNPKSMAYYMSVFSATGALTLPLWGQGVAILLLPSMATLYYVTLATMVSSGPARRLFGRASHWLDRVAGAAMLLFGAKLLVAR
ncbi:LysE family transporter [Lichenihabitans sp. Uapishka_5]|uniref:LysE family transporter n=1 Tax=Lichenihabitans sp. Uapishka_5 TaxID=3037302 RepID=UPI0029E80335|nr:LysE family transporter [Lichenihabitans sp. Uapishka_5]MDX7953781.1 LysE family transporter [Lichenihabitans sp. Uapishka_5]